VQIRRLVYPTGEFSVPGPFMSLSGVKNMAHRFCDSTSHLVFVVLGSKRALNATKLAVIARSHIGDYGLQ
jgi:hypothetical protein